MAVTTIDTHAKDAKSDIYCDLEFVLPTDDKPVRYTVDREKSVIGEGGEAVVLLANNCTHAAAIKVLLPVEPEIGENPHDPEVQKAVRERMNDRRLRFADEYATQQKLNHPNIVPVLGTGLTQYADGRVEMFIAQHLYAASMIDLCGKKMEISDHLDVALSVLDAMEYMHSQGVLHRDIKPENILLSRFMNPALTDFGIATDMTGQSPHDNPGFIAGTPECIAPETILHARYNIRSELYQTGITLFEMLTGEPPFTAETTMGLFARKLATPASLVSARKLRPDVTPELDKVLQGFIELDENKRYQTVEQARSALAAVRTFYS